VRDEARLDDGGKERDQDRDNGKLHRAAAEARALCWDDEAWPAGRWWRWWCDTDGLFRGPGGHRSWRPVSWEAAARFQRRTVDEGKMATPTPSAQTGSWSRAWHAKSGTDVRGTRPHLHEGASLSWPMRPAFAASAVN
jgi:hypothetical protein